MTKTIMITGGASGIGSETARLFARNGWSVAIADRSGAAARALAEEIGPLAQAFEVDVMDPAALGAALEAFCGNEGLDAIFNSAGLLDMRTFVDTPLARHHEIIDVNVKGVINSIHAALPFLRRKPGANVVTMCSTAAVYGLPEEGVYCASKFAVRALTESLNIEFESMGIWVSDIMVGFVNTPMVHTAEHVSKCLGLVGINVEPQDVAATVWRATQERRVHWFLSEWDAQYFDQINTSTQEERRSLARELTGF